MKLLRIDSSPRDKSVTGQLTEAFADAWKRRSPGGEIVSRDLTSPAIPPTGLPWIAAARIDPARRSSSEREALALSDELIAEVEAASVILIGAPLYNSSTRAPLKAWIDQIVRPGRTVQYSPQGPKGLLGGSKVIVVTSRSGEYSGDGPSRSRLVCANEPRLRRANRRDFRSRRKGIPQA